MDFAKDPFGGPGDSFAQGIAPDDRRMLAHPPFVGGSGTFAARSRGLHKKMDKANYGQCKPVFCFYDMARPEVIKTKLGERLRSVRRCLGDPTREQFAQVIGVSPKTLANHERGDSAPDANVLTAYREQYGVDINWIVTGEGEMFSVGASRKAPPLTDPEVLERLSDRVSAVFKELGQKPPWRRVTRESAVMYNELAKAVPDLTDREMIEAELPRLELQLKRRLQQAADEPGTGKRSVS